MNAIEIRNLDSAYLEQALELLYKAYREEKTHIPFLPADKDFSFPLVRKLRYLLETGEGVMAFQADKLVGYMAGFRLKELFSSHKGIYIPLYGHQADAIDRQSVYQQMYMEAAKKYVSQDFLSHAVTIFAHDHVLFETWNWLDFGIRCVDAIRENRVPVADSVSGVAVHKADKSVLDKLAPAHARHHLYYREAPIFMPRAEEDAKKDLEDWLNGDNRHLWYASIGDEVVGYMRIQPEAETFISEHDSVMNITGAYVVPEYRSRGVGKALLETIREWLLANAYSLAGVDFESINISGTRFWMRHFTAYTYSLTRMIDDRIR